MSNVANKEKELAALKSVVRKFLHEIEWVPFRAVDCNQSRVDSLREKLERLTGFRA